MAIFRHAPDAEFSTAILAKRAPDRATRWLRAFERRDGTFDYRYELPAHAWADTVGRPKLGRPKRNAIAAKAPGSWALKGDLGMVGIIRTRGAIAQPPEAVAQALLTGDAA